MVSVLIAVAEDGRVTSATVAQSSGYTALDEAALAAVRRWRFRPATRDGVPISGTVRTAVHFRLENAR